MISSRFISLVLLAAIRGSSPIYFGNNFKYMGSFIVGNDKLVTNVFSFSASTNVLGRIMGPLIWQKFDFIMTYTIIIGGNIIVNIIFLLLGAHISIIYLLLIFVSIIFAGLSASVHAITLFSLYDSDKAIYLYKIYDNCTLVGITYAMFLNSVLNTADSFSNIFVAFILIEVVGLVILRRLA